MGRVVVTDNTTKKDSSNDDVMTELNNLIKDFYTNDNLCKKYKKIADPIKEQIKNIMIDKNLQSYKFDDYKTSCSVIQSASFDPDILLAIVKDMGLTQLIKTKEYVDEDLLEQMLYKQNLDASKFAPAQIIKESVRLQVSKQK